MEVDSVGIIAILSMSYITTRIVKTDKRGKNPQSARIKPNDHTKCGKNCHKILSVYGVIAIVSLCKSYYSLSFSLFLLKGATSDTRPRDISHKGLFFARFEYTRDSPTPRQSGITGC